MAVWAPAADPILEYTEAEMLHPLPRQTQQKEVVASMLRHEVLSDGFLGEEDETWKTGKRLTSI